MRCVWQVEINEFCRGVLARHWPGVRHHDDVATFPAGDAADWACDVIAGGFPCQDASKANAAGKGSRGPRTGLWREYLRVVGLVRPRYVLMENVPNLLRRGFGDILGGLAALGYDAEWGVLPASAFGAPHCRERLFVAAYPVGAGVAGLVAPPHPGLAGPWGWRGEADLQALAADPFGRGDRWPEPLLRGVDDGIPGRVAHLTAYGNAVVPDVGEWLGRRIVQNERAVRHGGGGDAA
jgi:DNA (cytosine-5)-methyltransferase 1